MTIYIYNLYKSLCASCTIFVLLCYLNCPTNALTTCESFLSSPLLVSDVAYLRVPQLKDPRDFEVNICCQSTDDLQRDRQCFLVKKDQRELETSFPDVSPMSVNSTRVCASVHPCEWKVWLNLHFFLSASPHQRCYSKMCFPVLSNTSTRRVNRFCSPVYFHFLTSSSTLVLSSFCRGLLRVFVLPRDGWLSKRKSSSRTSKKI